MTKVEATVVEKLSTSRDASSVFLRKAIQIEFGSNMSKSLISTLVDAWKSFSEKDQNSVSTQKKKGSGKGKGKGIKWKLIGMIVGAIVGIVVAIAAKNEDGMDSKAAGALIVAFAKLGGEIAGEIGKGNGHGDGVMLNPNGSDCTGFPFGF